MRHSKLSGYSVLHSKGFRRAALMAALVAWGACLAGIALEARHQHSLSVASTRAVSAQPVSVGLAPRAHPPSLVAPAASKPRVPVALRSEAGTLIHQVDTGGRKLVALTFDDGPWPGTTDQVLGVLDSFQAKATFFWVGQALAKHPEIARHVLEAGHAVGNHSWHHWYGYFRPAQADRELNRVQWLMNRSFAQNLHLFRPPGGELHNGLVSAALRQGYTVVMWSLSSADTDPHGTASDFAQNVIRGVKPGAIVLMHDGGGNHSRTVQALPVILAALQAKGYSFVTVPELLKWRQL